MKTFYFSVQACNTKRRLEVRRCVFVEASHFDLAELKLLNSHSFLWSPDWKFTFVEITQTHYETLCGILEVEA